MDNLIGNLRMGILMPLAIYSMVLTLGMVVVVLVLKKKCTLWLFCFESIPICSWIILLFATGRKTISNAVADPVILAAIVLILAAAYLVFDDDCKSQDKVLKAIITVCLLVAGPVVFFAIPRLSLS